RAFHVTGVQTCALPISRQRVRLLRDLQPGQGEDAALGVPPLALPDGREVPETRVEWTSPFYSTPQLRQLRPPLSSRRTGPVPVRRGVFGGLGTTLKGPPIRG